MTNTDRPVGRDDDDLGREDFAKLLATHLALSRSDTGFVMALTGPWGTGKSSVVRMVVETLEDRVDQGERIVVVEFNPWFFSGTGQLTAGFLLKLANQVPKASKQRTAEGLAERLRGYADTFSRLRGLPVVGSYVEATSEIAKLGAEYLHPKALDLEQQRHELAKALADLDLHIIVLMDDVDRLQTHDEIRQVMQMVKLVGDLPGITYLLAFDPRPVREALTSDGIDGTEYLEKIVQAQHPLPAVSEERLNEMLDATINRVIAGLPKDRLDAARWARAYDDIVRPLVTTPRHVRRFGNALPLAIELAGIEIDLVDLISLTAVSTFLPRLHESLASLSDDLVSGSRQSYMLGFRNEEAKTEAQERLKAVAEASGNEIVANAVFAFLFPHTSRFMGMSTYADGSPADWKRLRRVADLESLYRYLTCLTPDDDLSAIETQRLLVAAEGDEAFAEYLQERGAADLGRLARRLTIHASEIDHERIPSVVRLLSRRMRAAFDVAKSRPGDPAKHMEIAAAVLMNELPQEQRRLEFATWFGEEPDMSGKLAVFEVGRHFDDMRETIAGEEVLNHQLDELGALFESTPSEHRRAHPSVGRLFWLITNGLLPDQLPRVHELLKDDFLFAKFLANNSEPNFAGERRILHWDAIKQTLGDEWVAARLSQIGDPQTLEDDLAETVRTAQELAARDLQNTDSAGTANAAPADAPN